MSKTIDEKVVEMRFDNKQFESNVQTSMSTLDKLKQALKFDGTSKGFDNLSKAANKVDLSGMGKGIEAVQAKFSALEVMGVTALANITNSAVNAGKNMVKALTIEPVQTGLQEYETQINAIQTIMSNTRSQGTTLDDVNAALDELNLYADKTIYNFTEMTRNIGTFTAAGVKLDTSVSAIKGIANLAAVSGSNAQQASTAMYQLSQALAAGTVKLQDWNSVVNAGMGGQVFQDSLKETARAHGIAIDQMIEDEGSFRETLSKGWLSSEILTETLSKFTGDLTEQQIISMGYTQEQAKEILALGQDANDAATKVKTFSQLLDTLKEAAQSGWSQTWRLVIGDFEEARTLWTSVSDAIGGIISKSADARNAVVSGVMTSKWDQLIKKVNDAGISTEVFESKLIETMREAGVPIDKLIEKYGSLGKAITHVKDAKEYIVKTIKKFVGASEEANKVTGDLTGKLEDFQNTVNQVIKGDFGNGEARIKALTDAGKNSAAIQTLVNKVWERSGKTWNDTTITAEDLAEVMGNLSEEEAASIGLTEDQTDKLRMLARQARITGMPVSDLIDDLSKPSGRELIIEAAARAFGSLKRIIGSVKDAWNDIFNPEGEEAATNKKVKFIYGLIEGLNELTKTFEFTDTDAKKLKKTFKGLFALLDIITTFTGGAFKIGFKVVSAILSAFNLDILDVTASIGDAIVQFRNWLFSNEKLYSTVGKLIGSLPKLTEKVKELYNSFINLPIVQKAIKGITDSVSNFKDVGKNIIEGLIDGLEDGITSVPDLLIQLGTNLLNAIKGVLGIHSPSTEFFEIGKNIILGLFNGIRDSLKMVIDILTDLGNNIIKVIRNIDIGSVIAAVFGMGMIATSYKLASAFENLTSPLESFSGVLDGFKSVLKSFSLELKAKAIRTIAEAIAILVGSVIALTFVKSEKLWQAVGVIGALAGILGVLIGVSALLSKTCESSEAINVGKLTLTILGITASLMLLTTVIKKLGGMNPEQFKQGFIGLAGAVAALGVLIIAYGLVAKKCFDNEMQSNIDNLGSVLLKISFAMLILVGVVKLAGKLKPEEMVKGAAFAAAFAVFVLALTATSMLAGEHMDKMGGTLLKMSIALMLLVGVVKIIGTLSTEEMIKGGAFIAAFTVFVAALTAISLFSGGKFDKVGKAIMSISTAVLLLSVAMKIIGGMEPGEIAKGLVAIGVLMIFIRGLITSLKTVQRDVPKMAGTLMAVSFAIGILAGVSILLGFINVANLAKGIIAVGFLSTFMAMLIYSTKDATQCKGTIIALTAAIAILVTSVAVLSMIDTTKLAGATIALSVLMSAFALMAKEAGNAQGSIAVLIVMITALGLMTGAIYILSSLPIESVLSSAISLSTLMLALSGAMFIMSKVSTNMKDALKGVLTLTLMAIPLAALVGVLALMDGLQNAVTNSILLTSLATVLTLLLVPLLAMGVLIGATGGVALAGIGAFALMCASLFILVGVLATMSGIENAEENANLLIRLMTTLTITFVAISLLGPLALIGVPALGAMMVLIGAIGVFMTAIGALVTYVPQIKDFLENALPVLGLIGEGIGTFVSGLVNGVVNNLDLSGLVKIGNDLSAFITSVTPFVNGARSIDSSALDGVNNLAKMMLMITAADVIQSLTSWVTGGSSITDFANQLKPFGDAIVSFSQTIDGKINESAVSCAASAGKMLAEMADTLPNSGGVAGWFMGENDMDTFGSQLVAFGNAIVLFSQAVDGKINPEAVECAANAGKIMAEMQNTIPNTGGVLGFFTGDNDLATFGTQLVAFGSAIVLFSQAVAGNIDPEAVECAANAGKMMAAMQETIPNTGGVVSFFAGDNGLDTFGTQLVTFGKAIVEFSNTVSGNIDSEAVECAANAGSMMAALSNSLGKDKSIWDVFDDDLSDFAEQIKPFGKAMAQFSKDLGKDFSSESVVAASKAGKALADMAKTLPDDGFGNLKNTSKLRDFADSIKDFASKIGELNTTALQAKIAAIKNVVSKLKEISKSGVSGFVKEFDAGEKRAVSSASKMVISASKALNSNVSSFSNAGKKISEAFVKALSAELKDLNSKFTKPLDGAVKKVNGYYDDFNDAGKHVVSGFANGISDNTFKAEAKAKAMAKAALDAAKEELKEHSPSKAFYKIGDFAGLGFVNALDSYANKAYNSGSMIAKEAKDGLGKAISKIKDSIESDMDTNPTIRPVVDLSNVTNGAKAINGMLDMNPSVGVMANLRSISSSMSNSQNGGNDDVISAINNLGKKISGMSGNTYTINGITYDDGSNVSNAVETLIRATRIERRV